jgi:hypothetical protein
MSSIDCILIPRSSTLDVPPFWTTGQTRLLVIFENLDNGVTAWGLDPDGNALVFFATLEVDEKPVFIQVLQTGPDASAVSPLPDGASAVRNDNQIAAAGHPNTIIVTDPGGGDGKGPKATIASTLYLLTLPADSALRAIAKRR